MDVNFAGVKALETRTAAANQSLVALRAHPTALAAENEALRAVNLKLEADAEQQRATLESVLRRLEALERSKAIGQ